MVAGPEKQVRFIRTGAINENRDGSPMDRTFVIHDEDMLLYRASIFVCNSLGHGLVGWSEALLSIHYSRFIKSSIYSIVASQEWLFVFWLNQSIGWRSCCSDWTLSTEHWGWSPAEALIYSKSIWYDLQRAFLLLLLRPRLIALQESGARLWKAIFLAALPPQSSHQ